MRKIYHFTANFKGDKAIAEHRKQYREAHRLDKAIEKHLYHLRNKEKLNEKSAQYRTLCPICKKARANSVHHIIPISHNGKDVDSNKVRLCYSCHNIVETYADEGVYYTASLAAKIRNSEITQPVNSDQEALHHKVWSTWVSCH